MRFITAICLLLIAPLFVSAQEKYSVVVGVEVYGSDFENLEFANEDATELGKALTKLGFTVKVMSSESQKSDLIPSNPDSILKIIRSMARNCDPKDTFVVSLSGHGIAFADDPVDENDERESYFCPQQAKLTDRTSLLPISKVLSIINECEASRKLVLIDACRDVRKVISKNGQKKGTAKKLDLGQVHQSRRTIPKGTLILFSCSDDQFSWQHDQLKHSVFTYHVIQYLRGSASPDSYSNERANLDGLVGYVKRQTNRYVFNNNLSPDGQYPVSAGRSSNWILGKIDKSNAKNTTASAIDSSKMKPKRAEMKIGENLKKPQPDKNFTLSNLSRVKAGPIPAQWGLKTAGDLRISQFSGRRMIGMPASRYANPPVGTLEITDLWQNEDFTITAGYFAPDGGQLTMSLIDSQQNSRKVVLDCGRPRSGKIRNWYITTQGSAKQQFVRNSPDGTISISRKDGKFSVTLDNDYVGQMDTTNFGALASLKILTSSSRDPAGVTKLSVVGN